MQMELKMRMKLEKEVAWVKLCAKTMKVMLEKEVAWVRLLAKSMQVMLVTVVGTFNHYLLIGCVFFSFVINSLLPLLNCSISEGKDSHGDDAAGACDQNTGDIEAGSCLDSFSCAENSGHVEAESCKGEYACLDNKGHIGTGSWYVQ